MKNEAWFNCKYEISLYLTEIYIFLFKCYWMLDWWWLASLKYVAATCSCNMLLKHVAATKIASGLLRQKFYFIYQLIPRDHSGICNLEIRPIIYRYTASSTAGNISRFWVILTIAANHGVHWPHKGKDEIIRKTQILVWEVQYCAHRRMEVIFSSNQC